MAIHRIIFASFCFLVLACGSDSESSKEMQQEDADRGINIVEVDTARAKQEQNRLQRETYPSSNEMTISKEGMEEKITAQLYTSPSGFPIAFYTYVPSGIVVENYDSGEGKAVQFNRNKAILKLQILPPEINSRTKALYLAEQTVKSEGDAEAITDGYQLKDRSEYVVRSIIGKHQGQYYIWTAKYPIEYADGFGAEIHFIKENMLWKNKESI